MGTGSHLQCVLPKCVVVATALRRRVGEIRRPRRASTSLRPAGAGLRLGKHSEAATAESPKRSLWATRPRKPASLPPATVCLVAPISTSESARTSSSRASGIAREPAASSSEAAESACRATDDRKEIEAAETVNFLPFAARS